MSDPNVERGLPASIEAERSILGSILLDSALCDQAVERLVRDEFFLDSHRRIYEKMVSLAERSIPIDLVTLSDELKRAAEFEQIGGATYIASLIDGVPRTDNIAYYADLIKEKARLRRLIQVCNKSIADALEEESSGEIIGALENEMYQLRETQTNGMRSLGEIMKNQLERLEVLSGRPEMVTGVPSGYTDMDSLTAGFQRKELIILAARPSQGKTALALNIGMYAAKQNNVVAMFSLEMSAEQLAMRILSSEARIDSHRLRTGYLNRDEWAKLADTFRRCAGLPFYIDDTAGIAPQEAHIRAAKLKREEDALDLVLVDYIGLMASGKRKESSRTVDLDYFSQSLKATAKALDVPVIVLSQLSRACELRSDHRPVLSDLRDSGGLEQNADNVIFIYRDEVYHQTEENKGIAEILISKQRNGPTGTLQLAWLKEFGRFENMWQ